MATLKLEIVTPEAKTFSDDVEMVTLPAVEGEMRHVFVEPGTNTKRPMPENIRNALQPLLVEEEPATA